MFERYTEKARRVIFFARYEASQYGSQHIDTEHILLGLLREDRAMMRRALGPNGEEAKIRIEIENVITKRKRFATSVAVPLSGESKQILQLAADEAGKMGHRWIAPEQLLLGTLMVEGSLASRILTGRGLKAATLRERLAKSFGFGGREAAPQRSDEAIAALNGFLANLKSTNWAQSTSFFAANAQVIDCTGKRWRGREEIENQFAELFLPYTKRDATFHLESVEDGAAACLVASVLWKNAIAPGGSAGSVYRMTVILAQEDKGWSIFLLQVTPVALP